MMNGLVSTFLGAVLIVTLVAVPILWMLGLL